jgi:hypothetical protein
MQQGENTCVFDHETIANVMIRPARQAAARLSTQLTANEPTWSTAAKEACSLGGLPRGHGDCRALAKPRFGCPFLADRQGQFESFIRSTNAAAPSIHAARQPGCSSWSQLAGQGKQFRSSARLLLYILAWPR